VTEVVELVERAQRGDADAFGALIEVHQEAMKRVATAILGDANDAADALQEALAQIWRGLPGLRDARRYRALSGEQMYVAVPGPVPE
jgi:DNA-directed RNA polymerase specialized sigma24 family protein